MPEGQHICSGRGEVGNSSEKTPPLVLFLCTDNGMLLPLGKNCCHSNVSSTPLDQ